MKLLTLSTFKCIQIGKLISVEMDYIYILRQGFLNYIIEFESNIMNLK